MTKDEEKAERMAAALRTNLRKRKAQARGEEPSGGPADHRRTKDPAA
ncbi:hypothetical protein [Sphingomonas mollis]|uniref:DUF5302 domain-containing protein n=1 Tax=Sphingomonas mollis TaxID=2795726 RepID=A0ABS0XQX3_9SPHN|nr:hypothetical protein [Sphingomonas sp. BT553]MBJ6122442.1 hypothetical protein [Sphingomonas sp. BT553]